ncbi:hypothetical protein PFISCL1PPCAC_25587, partial [Pristionchus fissidentatus]
QLLSLHSDFFSNLFFGPFSDKNEEVKEIKEISENEFVSFLQSLHLRRFEFTSARSALDALEFADRFLMPHIYNRVLPYLHENSLPEELLGHALITADRVPNNREIITWILTQFPSKSAFIEILGESVPSLTSETIQICLQSLNRVEQMDYEKMGKLVTMRQNHGFNRNVNNAGFHLIGYDSSGKRIEMEDFFCAPIVCSFFDDYDQ